MSTPYRLSDIVMCIFCKCSSFKPGLATHVVNYEDRIIIVKNVPCEECEQCGEKYFTDEAAQKLEQIVNAAKNLTQDISVTDYTKAA